jgi:hypothetical protein
MVEGLLVQFHVQEPAEQQVVIKLLAKQPLLKASLLMALYTIRSETLRWQPCDWPRMTRGQGDPVVSGAETGLGMVRYSFPV